MRLIKRQHYRTVYELVSTHRKKHPTVFEDLLAFARVEFGAEHVRHDAYGPKSETNDFLVLTEDDSIESSLQVSGVIATLPPIEIGLIFVSPQLKEEARKKINGKLQELFAHQTDKKRE